MIKKIKDQEHEKNPLLEFLLNAQYQKVKNKNLLSLYYPRLMISVFQKYY